MSGTEKEIKERIKKSMRKRGSECDRNLERPKERRHKRTRKE